MLLTVAGFRSTKVGPPVLSKRIVVTEPKSSALVARSRRTSYDVTDSWSKRAWASVSWRLRDGASA